MGRSRNSGRRSPRRDPADLLALSRRRVLAAALGAAGASAIASGLVRLGGTTKAQEMGGFCGAEGATLHEPEVWPAVNGLLSRSLIAMYDDDRTLGAVGYEGGGVGFGGLIPGPTLRLSPGDRIKLKLVNSLGTKPGNAALATNLHVHGLHVSPIGHGDNVFVHVLPSETFEYEYQIPPDHPTGLFWYHPHSHGHAEEQVNKGLAGAILITERPDEPPDVKAELASRGARDAGSTERRERLLVLQYPEAPAGIDSVTIDPTAACLLVNGQLRPVIEIAPGEVQRWRILNATANLFFNLHWEGLTWSPVAADGNWIPSAYRAQMTGPAVLSLGPAERAEVEVTGGPNDSYELQARWTPDPADPLVGRILLPVRETTASDILYHLATIVRDDAFEPPGLVEPPAPLPFADPCEERDFKKRPIKLTGEIHIDSKPFKGGRVDQTVVCGAAEEWVIVSELAEVFGWHPFHLHVNDFTVTSVSAGPIPPGKQDTVPVPPRMTVDGTVVDGNVTFRTCFDDFTGRFVYHCHFLTHEDRGMMAVVEVAEPVKIESAGFNPSKVTVDADSSVVGQVNAGTTVLWTNFDGEAHTVTSDEIDPLTDAPLFDSGDLEKGRSFAHTFDAPGTVAYHCTRHSGENGAVVVVAVKTVEIVDDAIEPTMVEVAAGTTVEWTNRDATAHSVTADDGSFDSGPLDRAAEATFSRNFDTAGAIPYHDPGNPAISGDVIVKPVQRRSVSIGIDDVAAVPAVVTVPVGSTVTWANRSITAKYWLNYEDTTFESSGRLNPEIIHDPAQPEKLLTPGQRFSHRFDRAGAYKYSITTVPTAGPMNWAINVVTVVNIVNGAFEPAAATVPAGTTVTWINRDSVAHTVTADDGSFASDPINPGKTFSVETAAAVTYHCAIHPDMTGTIGVVG